MEIHQNPSPEEMTKLEERARSNPPLHKQVGEEQEKCDRLTGRVSIVHEACGFDPTHVSSTFVLRLKNKEQPFVRRLRITEQETKIDLQWAESVGYLVITNKKQIDKATMPSREEREEYERHQIIISVEGIPIFCIRPEHSFVAEMYNKDQIEHLSLHSSKGEAAVILTAMPV